MLAENSDTEARIDALVASGDTDKAVALLYELAVAAAKNRDFSASETYRDRLYEVDSMALSRIVEVNEILEHEKSRAITPDVRRLWSRFFNGLSEEEANAFFFALKREEFDSEIPVVQQGRRNNRLYLVIQGQLKLTYADQQREILIHQMGSGDIFGEDTFFSVNVCTATVKTLTRSRLSCLERSDLERLQKEHGDLESNLKKICLSGRSVFDRLRQKGLDRRAFRRISMNTKVMFQVLSDSRNAFRQAVTGELWDISKDGLCFYFHNKNPDIVRQLIGHTVGVRFKLTVTDKTQTVAVTGVVQGVQSHPMEEYSVHVKLTRRFSDKAIRTIQVVAARQ